MKNKSFKIFIYEYRCPFFLQYLFVYGLMISSSSSSSPSPVVGGSNIDSSTSSTGVINDNCGVRLIHSV